MSVRGVFLTATLTAARRVAEQLSSVFTGQKCSALGPGNAAARSRDFAACGSSELSHSADALCAASYIVAPANRSARALMILPGMDAFPRQPPSSADHNTFLGTNFGSLP